MLYQYTFYLKCLKPGTLSPFQYLIFLCTVPPGFRGTFFRFLQPKITDFAAAFLKIRGDICGISYCFAVKIYH